MIAYFSPLESAVLVAIGLATALISLQVVACFPLTIAYEFWKRSALRRISSSPFQSRVSVVVPAYNEEMTIRACIKSLLESSYTNLEIIVVNDGSTDGTEGAVKDLIDDVKVRYFEQPNAGKAAALNRGILAAAAEVIVFTDADSIFLPQTVSNMVRWFADPEIDAVCGNDTPLHTRSPLQKVLAVTSHIGTGFVRRALSLLGVLPIISGNLGAVRANVFRELGGFKQIWGEDLEFTFHLQKARKRVVFDADPIVLADCPSDLRALWRQRIRWIRSYLKVCAIHSDLFIPWRAFPFSLYLPLNYFALSVVPLLQIVSIPLIIHSTRAGVGVSEWIWGSLLYLGLLTFTVVALYSVLLDRDLKTLKHIPIAILLIVPLSFFYSFVVLSSIWKECMGRAELWEKIERMPNSKFAFKGDFSLVLMAFILLSAIGAIHLSQSAKPSEIIAAPALAGQTRQTLRVSKSESRNIAIATHFDDWQDWHDAVNSVLQNPITSRLQTIGISAGRVEWAHFRWQGHQSNWSSLQKGASVDILGSAVHDFQKRGLRTVAIVDFYSPLLIKRSQNLGAVRFDGLRSPEQVCFTELVDGDYGQQIIEMVSYLSHNYSLDAIALTELDYHSFCFDDRCLRSYREITGRVDWPRSASGGGAVDRSDPSIWQWRSAKMQQFLKRVADAAHSGGKQLIVDVPVNWKDLHRQGKDSGLDYARVLQAADQIVIWNYFGVEEKEPAVSAKIVQDLLGEFPPDKFFVSVGLWGQRSTLDPQSFQKGLEYTLNSGATNVWITPNELMSPTHWAALAAVLRTADTRMSRNN